tara:strand:- start:5338 stop:7512 length:2175 start_codon:yes stop_codon:yes gene_type:complete
MKDLFENWRDYRKDTLNEVDPGALPIGPDPDAPRRAKAWRKTGQQIKKATSAGQQRTVKDTDPEAKPVSISGIPDEDEGYGTAVGTVQARDAQRQKFKRGEAAEAAGHLYSDEDLDDAQLAGEIGLIPAEAAIAGGLAGAKAAAYASPAALALAAGEAGVAAAESPYALRPGEQQHYRTGSDKKLASYFRSQRIKRKTDPNLQSKASLLKDLKNVKKYIQKTASGNIIIRGGGDYLGKAADEAKLSGLLASEIKANFLDIRKRLLALKKKPSTVSPEVREKLIAQAKKLGVDPEKYIANVPGERRRRMAAALAGLQEGREMKITKSQLRKLIKEVRALGKLDDIIKRVFPDGVRGARHLKMSTPDAELIADMLRTGEVEFGDLPWEIKSKWREAGGRMPDDLPGRTTGVSKDAAPVSEPTVVPKGQDAAAASKGPEQAGQAGQAGRAARSANQSGGLKAALNKNGELNGVFVDSEGRAFVALDTADGRALYMYSSGTSYLSKSPDGFLEASPRSWLPVHGHQKRRTSDGRLVDHYPKYTVGDKGFGEGQPGLWNNLYELDEYHSVLISPKDAGTINSKYLVKDNGQFIRDQQGNYYRNIGEEWYDFLDNEYGKNWPQLLTPENEQRMPKFFDHVTQAIQSGAVKKVKTPRKFGKYPEKGSELDRIGQELLKFSPDGTVTPELIKKFGSAKKGAGEELNVFKAGNLVGQPVRESAQQKKLKIILG